MRWERLFDDLASQLERELEREDERLARDDERLRVARLALRDRLGAVVGRPISVTVRGGRRIELAVTQVGRDWVAGESAEPPHPGILVPFAGIATVAMPPTLAHDSATPRTAPDGLTDRLGIAFVLRDLARRRSYVEIVVGSTTVGGTIDRVGRDHLDIAEHDPGAPRRPAAVRRACLVPLDSIELVRVA